MVLPLWIKADVDSPPLLLGLTGHTPSKPVPRGGEVKYGEGVAYLRSLYCARVNMLNGRIYSLSDPEPRYRMLSEPVTELGSL